VFDRDGTGAKAAKRQCDHTTNGWSDHHVSSLTGWMVIQNPQIGLPADTETERESTPGVLEPSVTVTPNVNEDPVFAYMS
jgi:hypothetical protein